MNEDIQARQSRWGSLITSLEDEWDTDDEDQSSPGNDSLAVAPGLITPLGGSIASGSIGGRSLLSKNFQAPHFPSKSGGAPAGFCSVSSNSSVSSSMTALTTSSALHSTMKEFLLNDWIVRHQQQQHQYGNNSLTSSKQKGCYLEKCVAVLHSLVANIIGGYKSHHAGTTISCTTPTEDDDDDIISIHPNFITLQNIIVKERTFVNGNELSTDFVECGDSIFCNEKLGESDKKYLAMDALGRASYELFMMGKGPSILKFRSAGSGSNGGNNGGKKNCSSLSTALSLHDHPEEDELRDNSERSTTNSSAASMEEEEDEIIDMLRKNARTTTSEETDNTGIISAMLDADIPFPLCRFVSDLLLDEHDDDGLSSMLFGRSEHSFKSFGDVLSDLKQMAANPKDFLHASSPDRWKLSLGQTLYGRDAHTQLIMDAADRVATHRYVDPLFDSLRGLAIWRKKEVVMVRGLSGAGKSRLVRSAAAVLEEKGWRFLRCKFDRVVHPEPLSILAFAFDEYFGAFASCQKHGMITEEDDDISPLSSTTNCSSGSESIPHLLQTIIGTEGLGILAKHIPSLRLVLKGVTLPTDSTVKVNETMMHTLFGKLLQVLSSKKTPVIWFIDDLQWADPLSLALLTALVQQAGSDLLGDQVKQLEDEINVMFVGSYRDNEVDDTHQLVKVLRKLQSDSSINVTDISLSGFTFDTLNRMLSESLYMPMRRVRSLSEIVIQKTDGQPLHVIEFIQALTMANLLTHSFARGWEWDADSIDICPITDSVAELYAFKLRRLPKDILLGLQILSCFGSQIDQHVLGFVVDYDGENSVKVSSSIDFALTEGLVERAAHLVSFAHDMIQKATIDSIGAEARVPLLRKLASALIKNASAMDELDSIIFVVVDFINRIGSDATSSTKERTLFAELNLRAGTKAIAVPDFAGATKYAENGISFLNERHWETQYSLSLRLFETAVLSYFSSLEGNRDQLKKRIDSVFEHAKDFSDKFKTHCVWIKVLSMTDVSKAIEESLIALERLGEPLDLTSIDCGIVRNELLKRKEQFFGERKKKFLSKNHMTDRNKVRAMKVMSSLCVYYHLHVKNPFLGAYVSCQMIKMSMDFGHCQDSVVGAAAIAAALVNVLHDIDEGSTWGRMTLSLMDMYDKNSLIPQIYGTMYGIVFVWKEPFQSTLEPLAQGIRLSFTTGNVEQAMVNTIFYVARSYNGGKNVRTLLGEVEALARQHGNHFGSDGSSDKPVFSPLLQFYLTPLYNILRELEGERDLPDEEEEERSFPLHKLRFTNNDDILKAARESRLFGCVHNILSYQMSKSLILRDMVSALKFSDMYYEIFVSKNLDKLYSAIWIEFYEGLITFYFMRQTGEERYQVRGESALSKMKEWSSHSDWNFMNKLLLMEAELHYTKNDFENAALCYGASIKAAQEHKFIHEEAIACELAGTFFLERGLKQDSYSLFVQSIKCYEKWGAHAVARRVEDAIKNTFESDLMQFLPPPLPDETSALSAPISTETSSKKRQR